MVPRSPEPGKEGAPAPVRWTFRWIGAHVRGFHAAVGAFLTLGALLVAVAAALFALITAFVLRDATLAADEAVLTWVGERRAGWLDLVMLEVTALGGASVAVILSLTAGIFLWLTRHRYSAALLWVAVAGSLLLNALMKEVFARARPEVLEWVTHAGHLSFPSGHAMNAVAVYGTLAYLVSRMEPTRLLRLATFAACATLIVLIGFTRVYLGVHYPTDVVAGFLVGLAWAVVCGLGIEAVWFFRYRRIGFDRVEAEPAGLEAEPRRRRAG
jgi:undecaprenyl-diphosphatase